MSTKRSSRLADLPLPVLQTVLEVIEQKYPPARVTQTADLATPQGILRLARESGAHSVVEDFRSTIATIIKESA